MDFTNAYAQGFVRIAARVLPVHLAQPLRNAQAVIEDVTWLDSQGVALVAYPELGLTGCTCDDLFSQSVLLDAAQEGLADIVEASTHLLPMIVVGVPLLFNSRVYNCAAVIHRGQLLGAVPKLYPDSVGQSYEQRWFSSGCDVDALVELPRLGSEFYLGSDWWCACQDVPGLRVHAAVYEDWLPISGSGEAAAQGATVLVNLAGSPAGLGLAESRKATAAALSARSNAAYVFTCAGPGESSTDLSWDGQTFIYECGELLGESQRFPQGPAGTIADVDTRRLTHVRYRHHDANPDQLWVSPAFELRPPQGDIGLRRMIDRFPFVPSDPNGCREAYDIQVYGLTQRLQAIGNPKPIIGVSGGLDSAQALIVTAKAMDLMGRPRSDILAFTMPGFATSDKTKGSAIALMQAMGTTHETIDVRPAAQQILTDLGHPFADGQPVYDVTFENVQAGVRTDYLFRIANQRGGIVIGTGDLSELALGWCTYGVGDHMSHYAVNAGVAKTLIRHLINWVATSEQFDSEVNQILLTILSQEVSPELVPASNGRTLQSTESIIGPYHLHDFFLYHFCFRGELPSRIAYLAWQAWRDTTTGSWPTSWAGNGKVSYNLSTITEWLAVFLKRFFANQFKRSASVDGPRVSPGGGLSPRSDWRMPSDASAETWLRELADNVPDEGD